MNRIGVITVLLGTLFGVSAGGAAESLDGTWTITACIEDGKAATEETIKNRLAANGQFVVRGQTITFMVPNSSEKRTILFATDDKVSPKAFDLSGNEKVSSKGIYMLMDDVLLICLGEPESKDRPTSFSAKEGSQRLLLTLHRVTETSSHKPPPPPVVFTPDPKKPPAPLPPQNQLRDQLLGTWGHQDDEWVHLVTLNKDNTFSASRTYKFRFGKLFHENIRSSGTWKVEDSVVILTCTASTNKDLINQVSSYRIRSITGTEIITVDQFGRLRRDWKSK